MHVKDDWHKSLFGSYAPPSHFHRVASSVVGAVAIYSAFLTPLLAFAIAGAGHGWITPVKYTWVGILSGPLTALAWNRRHDWLGPCLGAYLICFFVAITFVMI